MVYLALIAFAVIVAAIFANAMRKDLMKRPTIPERDDYTDSDDEIQSFNDRKVRKMSSAWIAKNAPRKAIYRDPYGVPPKDE